MVRGPELTDEAIESLMGLQEDLSALGLGRNRRKVAIGVHETYPGSGLLPQGESLARASLSL